MSYLGGSVPDTAGREDVMSQHSLFSDGSVPEDLLSQLHDFPVVPSQDLPLAEELLSAIYENKDPILAKDDFSDAINPTSETLLGPEGNDMIGAFLHASQILPKHPGLVMEHFDPATSVHTFKVACPRPQDGLSLQLSSPTPSSLSNGSSESSPLIPFAQTPPSEPFRRSRSVSSPSHEILHSLLTSGNLGRAPSSMSSSASDFSHTMLRQPRTLRRAASALSNRPPFSDASFPSNLDSSVVRPSHPLSNTYSHIAEQIAPGSVRLESQETYSRSASSLNSRALDASQSQSESMSSDELLTLREFLARRAEDLLTESSALAGSAIPDQLIHDDDASQDAASDLSEYGDSLSSKHHFSFHGQDSVTGPSSHLTPYKVPHPHPASVSESLECLDGQFIVERPSRAPSATPSKELPVASSARSLRRRSHTFSGSRSSALPAFPHYLELNSRIDPLTSLHELEVSDPSNPTATALTRPEELQDLLPDFLDLSSDIDSPRLMTNRLPFLGSEDEAAVPSGVHDLKRVEGDLVGPLHGKFRPIAPLVPRKVRSAAELSPRPRYPRPLAPEQNHAQESSDLQYNDVDGHRAYCRALTRTPLSTREVTRTSFARFRSNARAGSLAEYGTPAFGQSMQHLNEQHGSSYNTKLARGSRLEDDQRPTLGLHAAVGSVSSHDSMSRNTDSASQRWRAMTLQDAAVSAPSSSSQRRRSSSLTLSPPVSHGASPYRTLHDRAFRHPDVPYSPLLSEFVYSSHGAIPVALPRVDSLCDPHDLLTSFAKIGESLPTISSDKSRNEANVRPVPPRQRPRLAGPVRNNSYPLREPPSHSHAQRQQWSSLDLRGAPSLPTGLPSAIRGVGLSTVDNGAFEAPRPAPEPSTYTGKVARLSTVSPKTGKSDNASRGADSGRSQTPIGSKRAAATPSLEFVSAVSPMGFGGLSLRRYTWTKKDKRLQRSNTNGDPHGDGKSKLASQPSCTSVAGNEAKPQRRGLFKSLRRT